MIELSIVEIEFLLRLIVKSDAYNDGGRIAGILVNKLEERKEMTLWQYEHCKVTQCDAK